MRLTVLGCHGGESKRHRPTSFLLDGKLALDAGALTRSLSLDEQAKVESVLISHAHFDHVRDLATAADNRCQQGGDSLEIVATGPTLDVLRRHFFNGELWPDFTAINTASGQPTIRYRQITLETDEVVSGHVVRAVPVHHTIDAVGYVVRGAGASLAFSGDTGPTQRFWEACNETPDLAAILLEVSFPDDERDLAILTGHLCPALARDELKKLAAHHASVPVLFHHLKPVFEVRTRAELERIDDRDARPCRLDEELLLSR